MNKVGNYKIPFDAKGSQLHYPGSSNDWRENSEFDTKLIYVGYQRGRSAAYFIFKRPNGQQVTMFLKEFDSIASKMIKGVLSGSFRFIKRGENYGVLPVRIDEYPDFR